MSVHKITSSGKDNQLVTSAELQVLYEHLYKFMMDFLWEFPVVQSLANLEIAIFKRFPDKEEMQNCLRKLKQEISYTYTELDKNNEPDFKESMEELEDAIEQFEDAGCELYSVEEVIDSPDDVVDASDDIEAPKEGKRKFKIGDIQKLTREERELQEEAANTLSNPFESEE